MNYTCYFIIGLSNFDSMQTECANVHGAKMAVIDTPEKMQHLENNAVLYKNKWSTYELILFYFIYVCIRDLIWLCS